MSEFAIRGVGITQMAGCVPKNIVTIPSTERSFMASVGIKQKHVAPDTMTAADLGYKAARQLNLGGVSSIIFVSQTQDHIVPFVSNQLQHRLGLPKNMATLDICGGCAGFITGLLVAYQLATTGIGNVLLVISDTLARTTGPHDPPSQLMFGDAAVACIVEQTEDCGLSYFDLYSDGSLANAIRIEGGGFRGKDHHTPKMYMDGQAVFDFAVREIPEAVNYILDMTNCIPDAFVFHQSNKFIIKQFIQKLNLDSECVPMNMDRFGNTSGVSIPLTIITENIHGRVLLCGYGSGLTWGNCITDINEDVVMKMKEI